MFDKIIRFLASGFGLGFIPVAPGTAGSLLAVGIFYALRHWPHHDFFNLMLVVAVLSIIIAHLAEKSFGESDCQKIVIDEVAGLLLTYTFVSFSYYHLIMGFIFFRLFDASKVFPANVVQDKVSGGLGVVLDDLVAGVQAGLLLAYLPRLQVFVAQFLKSLPS